jgi:hypothetical protein
MMVAGCSSGGTSNNNPDMALGNCTPSGAEICDGKDNDCNGMVDEKTPSSANEGQFVAAEIMLPEMRTDYAIDLNGDGRLDNQLSALVNVLKSQGTNANSQIEAGILSGAQILLFKQTSSDATYKSDPCATASVYTGEEQPNPNLNGGGMFTIDSAVPSGNFLGAITGSEFSSVLPTLQIAPVTLTLNLVMFPGRSIRLPLIGAHITMTRAGGSLIGEIHGAIRREDVQSNILPTFAVQVQEQVTTKPMDPNSIALLGFFDDGGTPDPDLSCMMTCKNEDGSCAVANDGMIDTCEVVSNAIVQGVVASDVQMFSDDGITYKPNPANTHKDSLSMGLLYSAVDASF